jgi:murein DD-endopeptidase MepM/ murein hydrolase activator NlpD
MASLLAEAGLAPAAAASVSSDRRQIGTLEQQVAAQGVIIQSLVYKYDQAQANLASADQQEAQAHSVLVHDQARVQADSERLRQVAIYNYMTGMQDGLTSSDPSVAVFSSANAMTALVRSQYLSLTTESVGSAVSVLQQAERHAKSAVAAARSAHAAAQSALASVTSDRMAAEAALQRDQASLSHVKGNLAGLLAADASNAAVQRAQEAAMAAATGASLDAAPAAFQAAPGVYANPLRAVSALSPERIDQGVDYSGYGPVYAIGSGVVISTYNSGWPGGTFITYRLTSGPAAGLVAYLAEDVYPQVSPGQSVNASTVLGTMYEGPDGIETGWADPSGDGNTMARDYGQFYGSNSTAFGYNFSELLASLGAPPGILQNDPPSGSLPSGWPQF